MNKVDALVEEVLKEFLLDVPLVGKRFSVEHLSEYASHLGGCHPRLRGVRQKVITSPMSLHNRCNLKPWCQPIVSLSALGKSVEHLVEFSSHVVAYGNHRTVHEANTRAVAKTLNAHKGHQVEEHVGYKLHRYGVRKIAHHVFLVEEQVIVLKITERTEMVARQDGYDPALGQSAPCSSLVAYIHHPWGQHGGF